MKIIGLNGKNNWIKWQDLEVIGINGKNNWIKWQDLEVIGNIYENPELLEMEDEG